MKEGLIERLESRVVVSRDRGTVGRSGEWSPCEEWTGSLNNQGYGNIRVGERVCKVHRTRYILRVDADLASDLVLDHLCSNRRCCNLDHLDPVSQRENVARGESPVGHTMRRVLAGR